MWRKDTARKLHGAVGRMRNVLLSRAFNKWFEEQLRMRHKRAKLGVALAWWSNRWARTPEGKGVWRRHWVHPCAAPRETHSPKRHGATARGNLGVVQLVNPPLLGPCLCTAVAQ